MKYLKWVGLFLMIGSFCYGFQFQIIEVKKKQQNQQMIREYEEHRNIDTSILGTIQIVKSNKTNIIKKGNVEEVIKKNQVSLLSNLENKTIYLAGHSVPEVFGTLHESKIGDKIILDLGHVKTQYQIYQIKTIHISDTSVFSKQESFERLILITCMTDDTKRLIVFAKK